jgi:hypothetical protein
LNCFINTVCEALRCRAALCPQTAALQAVPKQGLLLLREPGSANGEETIAVHALLDNGQLHKLGYVREADLSSFAMRDMYAGRVQEVKKAECSVEVYSRTGAPSLLPAPLPPRFWETELGKWVAEHCDADSNYAQGIMRDAGLACDITGVKDNSLKASADCCAAS